MTYILGISALYHDSAACLIKDGEIIAAAQEERFSRKKHDSRLPRHATDYCLTEAGITASQLDHVVFYDKPLLKFDRIVKTAMAYAPRGRKSFAAAGSLWFGGKLQTKEQIQKFLDFSGEVLFAEHHEAHAMSAFYPSPFQNAAVLTIDGVGEWATTSLSLGRDNSLEVIKEIKFPHSLGLLYSAFTSFTGFKVNSGEYKMMGLAPYGEPKYVDKILDNLIEVCDDGSFRLNMEYFDFPVSNRMTSQRFANLFGGPARHPESELTQREMDLSRSMQEVTELVVGRLARYARQSTGMKDLCLAGGVALNCVANGKLVRDKVFDNIFIQPAAGDAGGALGAALACGTNISANRALQKLVMRCAAVILVQNFLTHRSRSFSTQNKFATHNFRTTNSTNESPICLTTVQLSAGFKAEWSSARAHLAIAQSSAMHATPTCKKR